MIHIFKTTDYVHVIVMIISVSLQYFHIESLFKNIHLPEAAVSYHTGIPHFCWWPAAPIGFPYIALYHTSQHVSVTAGM